MSCSVSSIFTGVSLIDCAHNRKQCAAVFWRQKARLAYNESFSDFCLDHSNTTRRQAVRFAASVMEKIHVELVLMLARKLVIECILLVFGRKSPKAMVVFGYNLSIKFFSEGI